MLRSEGALIRLWIGVGALYVLVMVAIPLRHHLTPGDVKWTGEGYLGSWQVMLSEKSASADFVVTDPDSGEELEGASP